MDYLLSRVTASTGKKLKITGVQNKLSAIRTCFATAGVSPPDWPDIAQRQILAELSARRRQGLEKVYRKPPLMPRVIMDLELALSELGSYLDLVD